jgi:hypothetical protein
MNAKSKDLITYIFTAIAAVSLFPLLKLEDGGGPCNSGFVIFFLMWAIGIPSVIQIGVFRNNTESLLWLWFYRVVCISCTLFLIFITYEWVDDPHEWIYMSPFLVINAAISVLMFIRFKPDGSVTEEE